MQIITDRHQKETKKHGTADFPFLVSYEQLSAYESGSFLWHWHPELELTLITSGEMIYHVNGEAFHLRSGDALLVNSGCLHSASMYEQNDCSYIPVTFDARLIYGSESSLLYSKYIRPIIQNPLLPAVHFDHSEAWHGDVVALTRRLIALGTSGSAADPHTIDTLSASLTRELDIQLLLIRLWQLLFLNIRQPVPGASAKEDRNYTRIRQILAVIEKDYDSRLTLDDISAELCLCKGECCRIFRRYMNLPLFEFLQQYRIEKSLALLADPHRTITEISALTGFSDPNYFAKVFRKQKGCSPSEYRRQLDTPR